MSSRRGGAARRTDWWELFDTLREVSTYYALIREDVAGLAAELRLAEGDLRSGSWAGYARAGWARDYFAMKLRAHTFTPDKSAGDLHNLRSLTGLVRDFIRVRDVAPECVDDWIRFRTSRADASGPDRQFLVSVSLRDWQPVMQMLNHDKWQPPAQTETLEEITHSPEFALHRLRTYADKRVAHLNVDRTHTYILSGPFSKETVTWHAATYVGLGEMRACVDLLEEAVGNLDIFFG